MNFWDKFFNKKTALVSKSEKGVSIYNQIPEPTRSLIFITHKDPSKATSPFTITINLSLTEEDVSVDEEKDYNFYSEPSLIWSKLPLKSSNDVERDALYYPSYVSLTPEQRYQYVNWLQDVQHPTNLSYVFLYYYGLERHLLIGDFNLAAQEIIKLLKHHDKGTFRSYAQEALIAAILQNRQYELFNEMSFLHEGVSNGILLMRKKLKQSITAEEIIEISSRIGFKNKRYIKKYPKEFISTLKKYLVQYENKYGSVLAVVNWEDLKKERESFFANPSLPDEVSTAMTPQLLDNSQFQKILFKLLQKTHDAIKGSHKKSRKCT